MTSRRNVANQRSYVIIIARKEGGAWEHNYNLARGMMRIRTPSNPGSLLMMYVRTYVSVTLRNVAVTSRRNVANQRSYVIIIARKEGGAWEHNYNKTEKTF